MATRLIMQVYELRTEFTFNLVLSLIDVGSTLRYYCISAEVYKEPFVTNAQRVRRRVLNKHKYFLILRLPNEVSLI